MLCNIRYIWTTMDSCGFHQSIPPGPGYAGPHLGCPAFFPGYVKTPDALSLEGDVACDLSLTGLGTMGQWQEGNHCFPLLQFIESPKIILGRPDTVGFTAESRGHFDDTRARNLETPCDMLLVKASIHGRTLCRHLSYQLCDQGSK